MGPHQMVWPARPGRCAGFVLLDHLVAVRQGGGARKLAPKAYLRLRPGDVCSPPVRWLPAWCQGREKNPSLRTNQDEGQI